MADPTNVFALDDVKFMTGLNLEPVVASESAIQAAIQRCYGEIDNDGDQIQKVIEDLELSETEAIETELDLDTKLDELEKAPKRRRWCGW